MIKIDIINLIPKKINKMKIKYQTKHGIKIDVFICKFAFEIELFMISNDFFTADANINTDLGHV